MHLFSSGSAEKKRTSLLLYRCVWQGMMLRGSEPSTQESAQTLGISTRRKFVLMEPSFNFQNCRMVLFFTWSCPEGADQIWQESKPAPYPAFVVLFMFLSLRRGDAPGKPRMYPIPRRWCHSFPSVSEEEMHLESHSSRSAVMVGAQNFTSGRGVLGTWGSGGFRAEGLGYREKLCLRLVGEILL